MSLGTAPQQHSSSTYLGQLNLCYGDGLEGMADIIIVPEWDLFMMEMIDRSGHHREPVPAKNPIW